MKTSKNIPLWLFLSVLIGYPLLWIIIYITLDDPDPLGIALLWAYTNIPGLILHNFLRGLDISNSSIYILPIIASAITYALVVYIIAVLFQSISKKKKAIMILSAFGIIGSLQALPASLTQLYSNHLLHRATIFYNNGYAPLEEKFKISYIDRRTTKREYHNTDNLIVSDIEGKNKKMLLIWDNTIEGYVSDYWWLDNNLILVEGRYAWNKGLFLLNPHSQAIKRILRIDAMNSYASYNRKTNRVCYVDQGYIFVLDLNNMKLKKLHKTDGFGLAWSPNGEKIMYCKKRKRGEDWASDILIYNIKENSATSLLNDNKYYYGPKWYDDNTFSCIVDELCIKFKLLENNSTKIISKMPKSEYLSKIWSDDKSKYIEILKKGDKSNLYYVEVDSEIRKEIGQNMKIYDLKWRDTKNN